MDYSTKYRNLNDETVDTQKWWTIPWTSHTHCCSDLLASLMRWVSWGSWQWFLDWSKFIVKLHRFDDGRARMQILAVWLRWCVSDLFLNSSSVVIIVNLPFSFLGNSFCRLYWTSVCRVLFIICIICYVFIFSSFMISINESIFFESRNKNSISKFKLTYVFFFLMK